MPFLCQVPDFGGQRVRRGPGIFLVRHGYQVRVVDVL